MIIITFHFCTYYIPIPYSYLMNKFMVNITSILTANRKEAIK